MTYDNPLFLDTTQISRTQYQQAFSAWAGYRIKPTDDFETWCDSDFDFIELLLFFENTFSLNLLDSTVVRQDFRSVKDFLAWSISRPRTTNYTPFRCHEPEIIPFLVE